PLTALVLLLHGTTHVAPDIAEREDGLPQALDHLGQAARSENEHHDHEEDEDLGEADGSEQSWHQCSSWGDASRVGGPVGRTGSLGVHLPADPGARPPRAAPARGVITVLDGLDSGPGRMLPLLFGSAARLPP